jgi:hypothetical protein
MYLKLSYCLMTFLAFTGCSGPGPSDITASTDRVKLYLYRGNTLIPVLDDTGKIKDQLVSAICSDNTDAFKCGYTGRIEYYNGDSLLLSGDYNLSESCSHITYVYQGEVFYKQLTKEGKALLPGYKLPKAADAGWLAGLWVAEQEGERPVYEEWWKTPEGNLQGKSYIIYAGDTSVNELLELKADDGSVYYIATVSNQNGNKPVYFEMQPQLTDSEYVFTNPEHDFPQRIVYRRIDNDSLLAVVSGGDSQFEVGMKRIKSDD